MAEYIKRDSVNEVLDGLVKRIENSLEHSTQFGIGCDHAIRYISNKVEDIPSADVRPERHGEWILDDSDEYANHFHCSRCGFEKDTCNEIYDEPQPNYCENCGAKMDGKDDK